MLLHFNLNLYFTVNKVNGTSTTEEDELYESYKNMQLEERNFLEKRVSVPDPNIVINIIHEIMATEKMQLPEMKFLHSKLEKNVCDKTETEEVKLDV